MSHKKKHIWKRVAITLMVLVILVAGVGAVLYKQGNPYAREWAYKLGLVGPSAMILPGSDWTWVRTDFPNGSSISAPGGNAFVLAFGLDGRFTSTTDCNSLFGNFFTRGWQLSLGSMAQTDIFCGPASFESEYASQLRRTESFSIHGTNLIITLTNDSGTMTFTKR